MESPYSLFTSREWDVFISYASEDRDEVVLDLIRALRAAGLRTWFDLVDIHEVVPAGVPADELRSRLREAIRRSRLVVLLLSEAFLRKPWPRYELDCVLELIGKPLTSGILPVLHNIEFERAVSLYPALRRLLDAASDSGLRLSSLAQSKAAATAIFNLLTPQLRVTTKTYQGITIIDIDPNRGDVWIRNTTREADGRDISIDVFEFSGNHLNLIDLLKMNELDMMRGSATELPVFERRFEGPLIYVQVNYGLCIVPKVDVGTFCNVPTSEGDLAMRAIFATPTFTAGIVSESTTVQLHELLATTPEAVDRPWRSCTVTPDGIRIEEYQQDFVFEHRHIIDRTMP